MTDIRKALCVRDLEQFNLLADGKIEALQAQLVDRAVCECVENGWVQILPYVSFSHLDVEGGTLNFVSYRRPDQGDGEERLKGSLSVGFGGHIDNEDEVYHTEIVEGEDGEKIFMMSIEDIKQTAIVCAVRELKEELGFNPFEELEIGDDHVFFGLEREDEPDDVGKVHLCLSIKVNLTAERYRDFFVKAKPDETEVLDLRPITVDMNRYVSSFNVAVETKKVLEQFESLHTESWSRLVIISTIATLVLYLRENFRIKDVIDASMARQKQAQQEQEAKEEQEQKQAQPELTTDPAVVTDVQEKPAVQAE